MAIAVVGRVSAADEYVTLTFGADFTQSASGVYVQGGFTVVDDGNFVTGLNDQVGTLTNVKWLFDKSPTKPPPSSAYVKVLKQKPNEPWRFTMVDQREIIAREPTEAEKTAYPQIGVPGDLNYKPAGYRAQSYIDDVYNFWTSSTGISLNALPPGYKLKTPGVAGPAAPLSIVEFEFVGFYFPDEVSRINAYTTNTPDSLIEWTMPGNFDWPAENTDELKSAPYWSPQMRFTFPDPHITADETCGNQQAITAAQLTPTGGRRNSEKAFISDWKQYRGVCPGVEGERQNADYGYETVALNIANWKEGFVSRSKHKDFFAFTVVAKKGPATGNGDPQFSGFQGQNFQFHGMADEVFNLISTPTFQMNGNFKYLSSGKCDYNETVCFTHPGTYVDQIGFTVGDIKIKAVAGSHEAGLRTWMNDIEIHRAHAGNNHKIIFAINNSTTETGSFQYTQSGRLSLDLPQFHVEVINSDYFFNMEVSLKDTSILRAGMKQVKLRQKFLCASEGMKTSERMERVESRMAQFYPRVPIHGLIGQTWRNALICDHSWVGDASDYVTSGLFATDSAFNYYGTSQ
jgi:hypothetical protein